MHSDQLLQQVAGLDLEELAKHNPGLEKYVSVDSSRESSGPRKRFRFADENALKELVQTQLDLYFDLHYPLANGFLIPRIANRLDYLLWIKSLAGSGGRATGIDIGVGGNCIYPLLGTRIGCSITGIDTDPEAIASSEVAAETAGIKVDLRLVKSDTLAAAAAEIGPLDFLICNPPFYAHAADKLEKAKPRTLTARQGEMYTAGGELQFAKRLFLSSKDQDIRWSSIMFGKKASVSPFIAYIKPHASFALHVIEYGQTKRWVVAWSFGQGPKECVQTEYTVPSKKPLEELLPIAVSLENGTLSCPGITWSRAYRRGNVKAEPLEAAVYTTTDTVTLKLVSGSAATLKSLVSFLTDSRHQHSK